MSKDNIQTCTNCVLPSTFPGTTYDSSGLCNHCNTFLAGGAGRLEKAKLVYREKFEKILRERAKDSDYDLLMCYSGGKDSTYTMDILRREYDLRILAITFDNSFISPVAFENMRRVVENLAVDHMIFKIRFDVLQKIFKTAAEKVMFPPKSLERASTICTSCISFVKFYALRTAVEKAIPFIGYGWSPGQAPVQASVMKTNPAFMKEMQKTVYLPLHEIGGDAINPFFLNDSHFSMEDRFPHNVHPLAFLEYNEEKIFRRLNEIGWIRPNDTDPNSTNCLMNAYANQIHIKQFGYNPYIFEIAKMVREGVMTRQDGLEKFYENVSQEEIDHVKKRLGEGKQTS